MTKENMRPVVIETFELGSAFGLRASSFGPSAALPPLTGITHGGQAFAEVGLLPFGFPLLFRFARLLFRAGTGRSTTDQSQKERRNQ